MVQLKPRPRREQQSLLAACTTSRPPLATATHLSRRADRDRVIGFGDVAAMPDPEWATAERPGRFTVAGLVPGGERAIALVPLHDPAELPLESELFSLIEWSTHVSASRDRACRALFAEDQERRERAAYDEWASDTDAELLTECSADIAAALAARPELAHDTALLMALAPVVAILKEVEL